MLDFFYNLNIELFTLNSTVLSFCSCNFEILHFHLRRPSFLSRPLIVVRKRKAFLEFLARELNMTCSLGWGFITQGKTEVDNWAVIQNRVCYHLWKIVILPTFQVKHHIFPQQEDTFFLVGWIKKIIFCKDQSWQKCFNQSYLEGRTACSGPISVWKHWARLYFWRHQRKPEIIPIGVIGLHLVYARMFERQIRPLCLFA